MKRGEEVIAFFCGECGGDVVLWFGEFCECCKQSAGI